MARSSYIYVVYHTDNHTEPVAAFTVKHEMFSWCRQHEARFMYLRFKDGARVRDGDEDGLSLGFFDNMED